MKAAIYGCGLFKIRRLFRIRRRRSAKTKKGNPPAQKTSPSSRPPTTFCGTRESILHFSSSHQIKNQSAIQAAVRRSSLFGSFHVLVFVAISRPAIDSVRHRPSGEDPRDDRERRDGPHDRAQW